MPIHRQSMTVHFAEGNANNRWSNTNYLKFVTLGHPAISMHKARFRAQALADLPPPLGASNAHIALMLFRFFASTRKSPPGRLRAPTTSDVLIPTNVGRDGAVLFRYVLDLRPDLTGNEYGIFVQARASE